MAVTDVIKNWSNEVKLTHIFRICESLKQNNEGYLCIKMLLRIFRDFQGQMINNEQNNKPPPEETMEVDE